MIRKFLSFVVFSAFVSGCNIPASNEAGSVASPLEEEGEAVAPEVSDTPEDTRQVSTAEPELESLVNDGTWVVSASSAEKEFLPELAVDGSTETRWGSDFEDDQWWRVDFGVPRRLGKMRILWEDGYARTYRVLVSADGEVWDEVYEETAGHPGLHKIEFEPLDARFVKIECGRRGTEWGNSFFEVMFNPDAAGGMQATATSGDGDYGPANAIDDDMSTRWSSKFNDEEWWQVDFGQPRWLSGLKISWETAFAEKYEVVVSEDGGEWRTVYDVTEGDGQTDILFFEPVRAKFLRIVCRQRGTGWGNSIWEIDVFDRDEVPQVSATTTAGDTVPGNVVDGDPDTYWQSEQAGEQALSVELPEAMNLGGVELRWGRNYPKRYQLEWSPDGEVWNLLAEEEYGNGGKDYIFFPATQTRFLRVRCMESGAGDRYQLAHLEVKSGEEQATPIRAYQAKAKDARPGLFPMWLSREQEFWTVVGVPDDSQESLLGETGTFEPYKGGVSVQPFVIADGKLYTYADVELSQRLEEEYLPLPTVDWKADGWKLKVQAVAFGEPGETATAVRYRLTNKGKQAATYELILAVRPVQLNPIWQHGGMSPINEAGCLRERRPAVLEINGKETILSLTQPDRMGAAPLSEGDIVDFLGASSFPESSSASDEDGKAGAGLRYALELQGGESADVVVVYPLHEDAEPAEAFAGESESAAFERILADRRAAWKQQLDRVVIDIPEDRLIETMKSNLAYVLINRDDPWFKPGTRNYNHGWIRDGALTGVAMLRLGKPELPKAFIERFSDFVNEDGWVPYIILESGEPIGYNPDMNGGEGHEFDSQGQFVFIVRQYYDFTGDKELVREVYPEVVRALEYGREIRKRRLTDEYLGTVYEGILPHSNSHEGYFPAKHSYWDDFWMLRGLKDGAYLAEQLGKSEDAKWMREEEEALREALLESIMAVIERDNLPNIPGCAELGDEDPTSTSIAIMACDETRFLPQPYLDNTFERYYERVSKRHAGTPDTFTPYEVRNADVFIRLGQRERAFEMLRHFMKDSMRPHGWNHMAEVVHEKPRAPSYIGDMPHTWVGSDYINAVRSMFSYVEDDKLVVGAGIDPDWLEEGVTVQNLPTQFGELDYEMIREGERVTFRVSGDVAPPKGFVLPLPEDLRGMRVSVNGEAAEMEGGTVRFDALPVKVRLEPGR